MALDLLPGSPILQGFVLAVIGVAFWVVGLLAANWLWQYLRGDSEDDGG